MWKLDGWGQAVGGHVQGHALGAFTSLRVSSDLDYVFEGILGTRTPDVYAVGAVVEVDDVA